MTGWRLMWRDLRRIVRGAAAFFRHLVSQDRIDIALGLFAAEARVARRGISNRYAVRIATVGEETRYVTLLIDISSMSALRHQDGHYGYCKKSLKVPPRTSTVVQIHYDWLHSAYFLIDGLSSPSDSLWRGEVGSPQLYSVSAVLCDPQGGQLDKLTIFQELAG